MCLCMCLWLLAGAALASPLDEPFVGGVGFEGPTTGDLTSVYWNPAALSLLSGTEIHLSNTVRLARTHVQRTAPPTNLGGEDVGSGTLRPTPISPQPGWFAGVGANVLGRFTIAVAGYFPSYQKIRYGVDERGATPSSYHAVDIDLRNFALVPALAVRMGKHLHVGLAPGFLFPGGRVSFDEDTAIYRGEARFEVPEDAARYRLDAGMSPFPTAPSFTLGAGVHYKREAWSVGLAYASRPYDGVRLEIRDGDIIRGPATTSPSPLCPPDPRSSCIRGELAYQLPDAFILGVSWDAQKRWAFTGTARFQTFSQHNRMVLTLAAPPGSGLGDEGLRSRFVLDRGFQDRLEIRGRVVRRWGDRARAGFGVRVAASAVPLAYVTPAAVDGTTFEPHAMAEVRLLNVLLRAGYALAVMPTRTVAESAFRPEAAVACVGSGRDLNTPACIDVLEGRGRPSAAGTYRHITHTFSMNMLVHF